MSTFRSDLCAHGDENGDATASAVNPRTKPKANGGKRVIAVPPPDAGSEPNLQTNIGIECGMTAASLPRCFPGEILVHSRNALNSLPGHKKQDVARPWLQGPETQSL
jgi:hypothetical protein